MRNVYGEKVQALKRAGFTRQDAESILKVLSDVKPDNAHKEYLYNSIVRWASEATGNNAAFDEEWGFYSLNELRNILDLPPNADKNGNK